MMRAAIVITFLQGLGITWAIQSDSCSERACEEDHYASLQSHSLKVHQLETHESTKRACDDEGLRSTGICETNQCSCDLAEDLLVPTETDRFESGGLNCTGASACQRSFGNGSAVLEFKDSNDYLFCDTGAAVACFGLQVSNVGAACFFNQNREGPTSLRAEVALAAGGCTNDVCCRGFDACPVWTLGGAHSLSCDGFEACYEIKAELTGDLFCKGVGACEDSFFTFGGGEHCVVGRDGAEFFGVSIKFNGSQSSITAEVCDFDVILDNGACLHLNCTDFSISGSIDVTDGSCYCVDGSSCPSSCNATEPCLVQELNCPLESSTACCAQGDCSDCCAPSTSTTTSTTKVYRREYRRNRRQHRRKYRQHRRNRRQYWK